MTNQFSGDAKLIAAAVLWGPQSSHDFSAPESAWQLVDELIAAESSAEALGARVEALVEAIRGCLGTTLPDWVRKRLETAIYSAPAADISARDARIRREEREAAWRRFASCRWFDTWTTEQRDDYRTAILNTAPPVSEGKEGQDES